MTKANEVWVSPTGDDKAPGTKARPLRTLPRAVALMRSRRRDASGREGRIILRGGQHFLTRPLVLDHRDSGCVEADPLGSPLSPPELLVIQSAPGERATLSAGRRITGFKPTPGMIHGRAVWVANLPAVKRGAWRFTQLWVNGRRAPRPRLPHTGTYRVDREAGRQVLEGMAQQGQIFRPEDRFGFVAGEVQNFHNLRDVEFVAFHFWIESRIPLKSVDLDRRIATLAHPTRMQLTDNYGDTPAPYYLDNVFEALTEPGQWYLDRPAGKLYYLPREGETIEDTEAIAPMHDHVLRIAGDAERGRYAEWIELRDLTISHCEFMPPPDTGPATPQAACHVSGAVQLVHARHCAVRGCAVEHVGGYGIEVTGDSADCAIDRCTVRDTAAGGVKVFHLTRAAAARGQERWKGKGPYFHPRRIRVADCHLCDGGHRWRQAVGVLVGNCSGVQVIHNHVHDFDYTGVSIGWTWGYQESHTAGNIIEWNHIHDIGRGTLSDMGGVYTLGQQPGTRIRYNHIHHIDSRGYGGWGIYPDEASSDMLIEYNLVHDTKCDPFSQHYGRENVVRNNIFALGRQEGMVGLSKAEAHLAFIFERNIVVTDGVPITRKPYNAATAHHAMRLDHNLYFDIRGKRLTFNGLSWSAWRKLGQDRHSLIADPGFKNLAKRDFTLKPNSPALKLGFIPFDLSMVGPRAEVK